MSYRTWIDEVLLGNTEISSHTNYTVTDTFCYAHALTYLLLPQHNVVLTALKN